MAKLTQKNLASLGAEHLAELLIDTVSRHPTEKRRLRHHLLENLAPTKMGADVSKRCRALASGDKSVSLSNLEKLFEELDLHASTIKKFAKTDAPGAIRACFHLMAATYSISRRVGGHDDPQRHHCMFTIKGQLKDFQNLLIEMISEHAPPAELLCQEFLDLPQYGYDFLMLLEPMARVMGDKGLDLLEARCQEIKNSYGEQVLEYWQRKESLSEAETTESNKVVGQVFILAHISRFVLLAQGKVQAFLKDHLPPGASNTDPKTLAMIANDLIEKGIFGGAEACLSSIPQPPAKPENFNWYSMSEYLLRHKDQDQEAHELRWDFMKEVQDSSTVHLYINIFEEERYLSKNTAAKAKAQQKYDAAFLRLKEFMIHEFEYENAINVCFDLIKEPSDRGSSILLLNAFMEHHGVQLSSYPQIPWKDFVSYADNCGISCDAATLIARELLKERKSSGQTISKNSLKLAQRLYKRAQKFTPDTSMPSHEEFIKEFGEKDEAFQS